MITLLMLSLPQFKLYMSYQKKSLILQELQQAIRKKAQQKSRNKQQVNRALQGSIEKKKNILKTATNKDARVSSIHKNSDTASKPNLPDKPVSIFNNDHLNVFDGNQFKAKKYNNRRLDKLVSLIQYMMSSSEKALRYISSTNFQAEFALKLYRSDRQNLVNELKNLNIDDIVDSQRATDKGSKTDQAYNLLLQENNQLKKEILILQKQAESYHHKIKDNDSIETKQLQRENSKLRQMLRKLMPFQGFKQVIELLEKQNKFEIMSIKSQENSKKTTEIQIVISSLQNQRLNIVENLNKVSKEGGRTTDRAYKLSEIQAEKEQLQKQLAQMKVKLAEIIDSGKSINQLELLKKNSELINERLLSLHRDLSPNSPPKKGSEQIIEQIRVLALGFHQKNHQLNIAISRLSEENEGLNEDISRLKEQKKLLQSDARSQGQTVRMQNMLSELAKLRDVVDELGHGQQISCQKISDLEQEIKAKEEQIEQLTSQLSEAVQKSNEFKDIINQLNEQISHIQSEFNRAITQNANLKQKLRVTQNDIISNSYSKEQLKQIQTDKENLIKKLESVNNRNNSLEQQLKDVTKKMQIIKSKNVTIEEQIRQLQSQIIEKDQAIEELTVKISKQNENLKSRQMNTLQSLKELNTLKKDLQFLKKQKQSSQKLLEQQHQRHIQEYQKINTRLHQSELLNIEIGKEKMEISEQLQVHKEMVQSLNKKIAILQDDITQLQDQIRSLTFISNEALHEKETLKELLRHIQSEKQILKSELESAKQQMEDHSEIIQSKNKQYVNLLRQILKGLMIDPSEYADKNTFEELLQFGSQQVVQIRKRQREEQSNKRKNNKRDYDNELRQFNQQNDQEIQAHLEACRAQLLFHQQNKQTQEKGLLQEKVDIDQFDQLKQHANNSILSEQNQDLLQNEDHAQVDVQEYLGMSQSMTDEDCYLPQKLSLNSVHRSEQECYLPEKLSLNSVHRSIKQSNQQIYEENNYHILTTSSHIVGQEKNQKMCESNEEKVCEIKLTDSQIQDAEYRQTITQLDEVERDFPILASGPVQIIISSQKYVPKQQQVKHQHQLQQKISIDDKQAHADEGMDNDSMLFNPNLNLQNLQIQPTNVKPKIREPQGYSKHTLLSIALKDQRLDLDQCEEVKSVGNHSFVSSNQNFQSNKQIAFRKQQEGSLSESQVKIISLDFKNFQNQSKNMNFSEFKQIEEEPMSQSMLSEKQNQHNIDEFGEIGQNQLSQSMVSAQQSQEQPNPVITINIPTIAGAQEQPGLADFGDLQDHMNDSVLSQKKSEHGLSQFGELPEERLNQSLMSQKIQKESQEEHGMSEFGEVQEDQMNDSILSENYNNLMKSNRSAEKENLDDFDQYKSQQMNQSIVSQKEGGLQHLKSDESFESP